MTKATRIRTGVYTIDEMDAIPAAYEPCLKLFKLSNMIAWIIWACYLGIQAIIILEVCIATKRSMWRLWLGWFVELCASSNDFVHVLHLVCQLIRPAETKPRPQYRLSGDVAPTVDVFVPCCGEAVEILLNTIGAAAGQDYPAAQLRIFVLDDAGDVELQKAVTQLNKLNQGEGPIVYRSRRAEGRSTSYFKAGNLRFGMEETALSGGSEFIASIDADMIADPEWLRRMIPHMLVDDRLGMINQSQRYYNVSKNDFLAEGTEFDMWYSLFEPLNDHVGEALCQGSGFVFRRSAVEDIGGWPLAQTGEDVMCSLGLLFKGWRLAYVWECLQYGLTPDSFEARLKQKTRWAGDILEFISVYGFWLTTITLGALAHRDLTAIPTTLALVMLPLVVLTTSCGLDPIALAPDRRHMLRSLLLLTFFSSKVNDYVTYHHIGLTRLYNYQSLNLWCAPCGSAAAVSYLRALLPSAAAPSFFITGTYASHANERSSEKRAGLIQRLSTSIIPSLIGYVLLSSIVLVHCLRQLLVSASLPTGSGPSMLHIAILPGSVVKLTSCIWKAFIPVQYMLTPPDVPEWTALLQKDTKGVMRPRGSADETRNAHSNLKDPSKRWLLWIGLEMSALACVLWCQGV